MSLRSPSALVVTLVAASCSRHTETGPPRIEVHPGDNVQIVAGNAFNCILAGATVRCCGQGWEGELGNGGHEDEGHLVDVIGLSDVVAITAGGFHVCARKADGSLWCWGEDKFEQLGYSSHPRSERARKVEGLGGPVRGVALGIVHSCALVGDGTVWCFGANNAIGIGAKDQTSPPLAIAGLSDVVEIAAASFHTCARRRDGTVMCWGPPSATPVAVANVTNAVELALTDDGGCARIADGTVSCWGGRAVETATPIAGITGAVQISARATRTCARKQDGSVVCWAPGGTGPAPWPPNKPGAGFASVAVGGSHVCALDATHALVCEGTNMHGELCNGSSPPRSNTFPPPPGP